MRTRLGGLLIGVAILVCALSQAGVQTRLPAPGVYARETIACVETLDLTAEEKDRIYWVNAESCST